MGCLGLAILCVGGLLGSGFLHFGKQPISSGFNYPTILITAARGYILAHSTIRAYHMHKYLNDHTVNAFSLIDWLTV